MNLRVSIAFNPTIDCKIDQAKDAVRLLLKSNFNTLWVLGMKEELNLLTD